MKDYSVVFGLKIQARHKISFGISLHLSGAPLWLGFVCMKLDV